jgi:protein gp37
MALRALRQSEPSSHGLVQGLQQPARGCASAGAGKPTNGRKTLMGSAPSIEWTDASWNPTRGCSRVSEGCKNCYAEKFAARFARPKAPGAAPKSPAGIYAGFVQLTSAGPRWTGKVELVESKLEVPLHWRKPRRIFVDSMSDLLHEKLSRRDIVEVFAYMSIAGWHQFQILTKRAERLAMLDESFGRAVAARCDELRAKHGWGNCGTDWPLPNVWLGVSCENQETADARIPLLLQTPAAVRFASVEPMLAPIDLDGNGIDDLHALGCGDSECPTRDVLPGCRGLDWVVLGFESGPNARPGHPNWARRVRDDCQASGVPFLFKQWGAWAQVGPEYTGRTLIMSSAGEIFPGPDPNPNLNRTHMMIRMGRVGKKAAGRLLDGREWNEYPEVSR